MKFQLPISRSEAETHYPVYKYRPWAEYQDFVEIHHHDGFLDLCGMRGEVPIYLSTRKWLTRPKTAVGL